MAPGYQRIRGFIDLCESHHSNYKIYQEDFPHSYDKLYQKIETIYDNIEKDYKGQKKRNLLVFGYLCQHLYQHIIKTWQKHP